MRCRLWNKSPTRHDHAFDSHYLCSFVVRPTTWYLQGTNQTYWQWRDNISICPSEYVRPLTPRYFTCILHLHLHSTHICGGNWSSYHIDPKHFVYLHVSARYEYGLCFSETLRSVISYRCFGTPYWSHIQGQGIPRTSWLLDYLTLENGTDRLFRNGFTNPRRVQIGPNIYHTWREARWWTCLPPLQYSPGRGHSGFGHSN